jgi:hypothetical protein
MSLTRTLSRCVWTASRSTNSRGEAMNRADIVWITGVALVAVTIAPLLKAAGLLPHDLLMSWGMSFPGLEQVFFGPLMAALLLLCFLKTGRPSIFPAIGILRALALGFVFPANLEHLGTGIAGIFAGFVAAALMRNGGSVRLGRRLSLLAALYSGLYAVGNYITSVFFGPAAQTRIIMLSPEFAVLVAAGAFALGGLLGAMTITGMRLTGTLSSRWSPRQGLLFGRSS